MTFVVGVVLALVLSFCYPTVTNNSNQSVTHLPLDHISSLSLSLSFLSLPFSLFLFFLLFLVFVSRYLLILQGLTFMRFFHLCVLSFSVDYTLLGSPFVKNRRAYLAHTPTRWSLVARIPSTAFDPIIFTMQ